jgi:hypothetical protein
MTEEKETRKPSDELEISAAAEEVKRIKEIGDAQRTFDLDKLERFKFSPGNGKQNEKKVHFVQKYSEPGLLAEAVVVDGVPYFAISRLRLRANPRDVDIVLETSIPIDDKREYKPFDVSSYLNQPYRFSSKKDFEQCIEKARRESLDSLYRKVKGIWTKYIDADDFHISICAADTIFTYYQDKVGLTHYLFFVGGNDSGKSNNLFVLKHLAYRNLTSTGMTVANIYQFLGNGEEGQGTLCYDEADKLDEDRLMMAALKNGYLQGCPVARIDTSFGRIQQKFNTYCWKAFAAEKFLDPVNAKGLIQRCIELKCYAGDPDYDIVEVIDDSGSEEFRPLKDELNDIHNLLLAVRLLHYHEIIPDVKLNIKRREKQLFKPLIRIFQNARTLDELLPVISRYVTRRREANSNTQHAFLYRAVADMIKSRRTSQLESSFIWNYIKETLPGADIAGRPLSYETSEFGTITQREVIQTLEHVFGAKGRKSHGIRMLDFDRYQLQRLGRVYDLATEVQVIRDGDDSFEKNRGENGEDWTDVGLGRYFVTDPQDERSEKNDELYSKILKKEYKNSEENTSFIDPNQVGHPVHPSHAPHAPHAHHTSTSSFSCYHNGCDFHTDNEQIYQSHGATKHTKNPLLYPSKAEIEKYGLQAQGKNWEK